MLLRAASKQVTNGSQIANQQPKALCVMLSLTSGHHISADFHIEEPVSQQPPHNTAPAQTRYMTAPSFAFQDCVKPN
jgi:hypothetical protein